MSRITFIDLCAQSSWCLVCCLKLKLQLTKSVFGNFMFMTFHTLIDFDAHRMTRRKKMEEEKHNPKYAVNIPCPLEGALVFLWPALESNHNFYVRIKII